MIEITLMRLLPALALVFAVAIIYFRWSHQGGFILYATTRMIIQLIAIGFVLNFIFNQERPELIAVVLAMMMLVSSWIALGSMPSEQRKCLWFKAFVAIVLGGGITFYVVIAVILQPDPWYTPRVLLPLAGMIYANSMNGISLGGERFLSEINGGKTYADARNVAYRTSLIPITNAFLAVGLVSLPGMMTGQILAGASPLIAVRYQLLVMCMVLSATGLSSAIFLYSLKKYNFAKLA